MLLEKNQLNNNDGPVCTDDAILEIADKMPLKVSDFLAVAGLEKDFINLYANEFLKELNLFRQEQTKEVLVSKSAHKVLHHYKDRLANISKTNPNLYMGRVEKIRSFDLFNLEEQDKLREFITNKKVKVLKLDIKQKDHDSITTLYRTTNKELRETGSYSMYIAYPYVEGLFARDKFPIKAPLLYFPVKLERSKREFSLKKDEGKDIIFNRDLLLLVSKMESSNLDINMPNIDDFSNDVLNKVINYYESNNIKFNSKVLMNYLFHLRMN